MLSLSGSYSSSSAANDQEINGTAKSRSDISKDISSSSGGKFNVELSGSCTVPADVLQAISESKAMVMFKIALIDLL